MMIYYSATQTEGEDHTSMSWDLPFDFGICSLSCEPFERFSMNFTQMFPLVKRYAQPMSQPPRLKVKATH